MQSQITLPSFVGKLKVKGISSDTDQRSIMDSTNVLTIDDRWRKLIAIVQATISLDLQDFLTLWNSFFSDINKIIKYCEKNYGVANAHLTKYLIDRHLLYAQSSTFTQFSARAN